KSRKNKRPCYKHARGTLRRGGPPRGSVALPAHNRVLMKHTLNFQHTSRVKTATILN
ncbi:hypothetical protein KUCAC02_033903, partial [Chaenocephalus aceratus]